MGRTLALLPGFLVVAGDVQSLFGGPPRLKIENVPPVARVSGVGFALSSDAPAEGELAVDVIRLVTAPEVEGNARTASSLVRKIERASAAPKAASTSSSGAPTSSATSGAPAFPPASALLDVLVDAIVARAPAGSLFVRPRALLSTTLGKALCERLDAAGLVGRDLETLAGRPDFVVDAFEVRKLDDDMARVSGAGQGPTLAAGLAPHVVTLMVDLAGGADVWKSGYDAFARRVATLQVERALHRSLVDDGARSGGTGPAPCRVFGSAVFPALSSSESRLSPAIEAEIARLAASGEKNPKIDALVAQFHKRLVKLEGVLAMMRALDVEVRVPALQAPPEWWTKQDALNTALASVTASGRADVVVMGVNDALAAHVALKGLAVTSASTAWFHVSTPDSLELSSSPAPAPAPISFAASASATSATSAPTSAAAASSSAAAPVEPAPVVRVLAPESVDPQATSFSAPLLDDDTSAPRVRSNVGGGGSGTVALGVSPPAAPATHSSALARSARAYDEPFVDPGILVVAPFIPGTLRVVVDGVAIDDAESRLDVTSRRGDDRLLRLLGVDIPAGAVVCIERDPPLDAIAPVPIASVPIAPVAIAPVASAPVASAPVANAPVANAPVASVPIATSAPVGPVPVASSAPVASAPVAVASAPVASAPVASAPVATSAPVAVTTSPLIPTATVPDAAPATSVKTSDTTGQNGGGSS